MAELPRYRSKQIAPQGGGGVAQRATSQMFGTLADRIEGFRGAAVQELAQATEVEAKQDAQEAFSQRGMQAEVNNDMTVYGQTYSNALTNMHKKRLAIDTGENFKDIYENNKTNPVAFQKATDEAYKSTVELLPENLRAEYAIDFEANKAHYSGQVNSNRIKLDKEKDLALTNELFTQSSQNASRASRDGNHDLALYEINKGTKALDSALENRTISAEQHRKGIADIKHSSSKALFKGVNDKHVGSGDLQGSQDFIESFRTSDVPGYSDEQRESLADEMQTDLNRQIKQDTVTNKAAKAQGAIVVKDAIKVYKAGKKPENIEEAYEAAALVSPAQVHELRVSEQAYNIIQTVGDKTLPEQRTIINAIEADPNASRVDIEALNQAKKDLSDKMALAEKDPYSLGAQEGLYEQTAPITPFEGIENLAIRSQQADMTEAAYGTAPKLFTDAEAQQFTSWLENPETSISEKLDFISQVEEFAPDKSTAVYDQFMKKGSSVFAYAGTMMNKGDRQKAEMMLRGQIILREQPGVVPSDDMQWKLNGTIGNALRYQGGGTRKALSEASTSYYAALAENEGKLSKDTAPLSLVKQAVQDVTGGVGVKNDQNFFLPPQAEQDDVDDWLDNLTSKDFENVSGVTSEEAVNVVERGQLISVGEGKYQVVYQGKRLMSQDGTPFIMEYTK